MVAPAALTASATSSTWSRDSTEQGPAITARRLPPMEIPLTGTSLGWDLASRLPRTPAGAPPAVSPSPALVLRRFLGAGAGHHGDPLAADGDPVDRNLAGLGLGLPARQ